MADNFLSRLQDLEIRHNEMRDLVQHELKMIHNDLQHLAQLVGVDLPSSFPQAPEGHPPLPSFNMASAKPYR